MCDQKNPQGPREVLAGVAPALGADHLRLQTALRCRGCPWCSRLRRAGVRGRQAGWGLLAGPQHGARSTRAGPESQRPLGGSEHKELDLPPQGSPSLCQALWERSSMGVILCLGRHWLFPPTQRWTVVALITVSQACTPSHPQRLLGARALSFQVGLVGLGLVQGAQEELAPALAGGSGHTSGRVRASGADPHGHQAACERRSHGARGSWNLGGRGRLSGPVFNFSLDFSFQNWFKAAER